MSSENSKKNFTLLTILLTGLPSAIVMLSKTIGSIYTIVILIEVSLILIENLKELNQKKREKRNQEEENEKQTKEKERIATMRDYEIYVLFLMIEK
jgi:large-conductance mechanosensitive channel